MSSAQSPAPRERSDRRVVLVALVLIMLAGSWLRAQEWSDPWAGMHRAWGGAVYSNMARNLVRYDLADTRLGLIASTGRVAPADFEFYYHHPPLNVWAIALSFKTFGVSEWSARVVSLAASVAALGLLYGLTAQFFSRRAGLAAAALLAFAPGELYYADHVDPYGSLSLFFPLLAVFGYARWIRSQRSADFALCLVGVWGGCLTTWTPYFVVPLILIHASLTIPRAQWRERAALLALPASAVAAFALFVLHRQLLLGPAGGGEEGELYGSLLEKLSSRGVWASWLGAQGPSAAEGWLQHAADVWRLFTPLPIALFALWLLDLVRRCLSGTASVSAADGIPGLLLGYGLLHNLAFPGTLHGHDFLVRCYAAGLALTGGVVLSSAWDRLRQWRGAPAALVFAASLFGLWLWLALPRQAELRERTWDPAELMERAERIRGETGEGTRVLLALRSDRVLQYYLDRPAEFEVASPAALQALTSQGRDAVWVVTVGQAPAAEQALRGVPHSRRRAGDLVVYRIKQGESVRARP